MPMAKNYYENLSDTMLSDIVENTIMGVPFMERIRDKVNYATNSALCLKAVHVFFHKHGSRAILIALLRAMEKE